MIFPEAGGGSCDFCNIGRRSAGFDEISYAGRRFGTLKMQTVHAASRGFAPVREGSLPARSGP